jgi:hypothetical protein
MARAALIPYNHLIPTPERFPISRRMHGFHFPKVGKQNNVAFR